MQLLVVMFFYISNKGSPLLQNLLTSNPSLASVFSTREKLLPLFECFSVPAASKTNIPQLCLSVLSLLTTCAPCLEAMVADGSSLLLLLQMLHSAPACREGILHVLYALAGTPELAWSAAKHGGVVYILELLLPLQRMNVTILPVIFPFLDILLMLNINVQKKYHCCKGQLQLLYLESLFRSRCMGLELP